MEPSQLEFFGNYKVLRVLSNTSQSHVVLAICNSDNQFYACKILSRDKLTKDDLILLEHETRIHQFLNHENIIKFKEVLYLPKFIILVTEYCCQGNLIDSLKEGLTTTSTLYTYCYQIFKAISYLHKKGYVHLDLKPDNIFLDEKYKGDIYLYDSERDSFMMALKALGYSMNTENEDELQEAYEWLVQCVQTMEPEIVTDEIIDNMAQGRKALGLIYSGDATYVMAENENMGYYMPETGTNLWSDAMVIPKNARNVELAHAFINYASDYDGAYDNSSYVGYTSANQEVMEVLSGEGGDYEGINAYIPRTDNPNDEVFVYNEETKKIIGDLWSRVKIAASNAD